MKHYYSPSFGIQSPQVQIQHISLEVPKINPKRQVSLMYGVQFTSRVPLFQRTYSTIEPSLLNQLSQQQILNKVYIFLMDVVSNGPGIFTLLSHFKQLQSEMGISIFRSRQSMSSEFMSEKSFESVSENKILKDLSNKKVDVQRVEMRLIKNRSGSMIKSNRISIADAIKITEIEQIQCKNLNQLQSINSISSVQQSQQASPNQFHRNYQILSLSSAGENQVKPVCKQKEKKISIMMGQISLNGSQFDSQIFSDQGDPLSLKNLTTPLIQFDQKLLSSIFDSPCPFLINLSLCLLCKCLALSGLSVSKTNIGWLLTISTIVAYKIYYDEPITGLIDFYGQILRLQGDEIIILQRWFLQKVGYEVVVSSKQYQAVLFELVRR